MTKESPQQRRTVGRVMHEFKHGELKRGRGGKVKNRRQAIAIALHEAGASKYESKKQNRKNLAKSKRKEARGETAQQEREGKSRVGARGRRESSRAMRGGNSKRARSGDHRSSGRKRGGKTKAELYAQAKHRKIPGRSKMSKGELERALG
ncbi:MAG: DUF6496 domain-containing protein [Hyphomicrobiales bacterium]